VILSQIYIDFGCQDKCDHFDRRGIIISTYLALILAKKKDKIPSGEKTTESQKQSPRQGIVSWSPALVKYTVE